MITHVWCAHLAGPDEPEDGATLTVRDYRVTLCAACWRALGNDRTASRAKGVRAPAQTAAR